MIEMNNFGSQLIIGFLGTVLPPEIADFIVKESIGGVILFKRNCQSADQLYKLCDSLNEVAKFRQTTLPFFIAIDQEGGLVNRLDFLSYKIPSALSFGVNSDVKLYEEIIYAMSHELKQFGINLNFAPVVDLYRPFNQQLITRCFSNEPEIVIRYARSFIKVSQQAGIIPCIKHFPGLGKCLPDTHHHAGIIESSWDELLREDLRTFEQLIKENVPMIMVNHAAYPELTGSISMPASLSKHISNQILRKKFGFKGLSVSDDLEMGAITNQMEIGEAAVEALNAGQDMLLICKNLEYQKSVCKKIKQAIDNGRLKEDRLKEAQLRWRKTYNFISNSEVTKKENYAHILNVADKCKKVFQNSCLIFQDEFHLLPLQPENFEVVKIGCFLPKTYKNLIFSLEKELQKFFQKTKSFNFFIFPDTTWENWLKNTGKSELKILIGQHWKSFAKWEEQFFHREKVVNDEKILLILTGDPAEKVNFPSHWSIVTTHNLVLSSILYVIENKSI